MKRTATVLSPEEMKEQKEYIDKLQRLLAERYQDRLPLAHLHSYGCQQNVSDGEKLSGMLAEMGFGFCERPADADFVLYNTCAVRKNAEDRVFGNVGALKGHKREKKGMIIGLCGCMMQQDHIVQKLKAQYPFVDLVFGTYALYRLPELLYSLLTERKNVYQTEWQEGQIVEDLPIRREGNFKAFVPIMYGCDNFCTYCIVPYVRGRERSRASQAIISEVKGLVAEGFKEITLLGQNVNSYGEGLEETIDFAELLEKINAIEGEFWVRFMTSHPKDATKKLIDTIASCDKICKHFHLPVQSGSDRILSAMNRHYTAKEYLDFVAYARGKMPNLSFTSDIIVGFPGEEHEDFIKTIELIQQVEYDSLFTFIYSKREGTVAANMEDPIAHDTKTKWFSQLLAAQKEISAARAQQYIGKTIRVLVEAEGKTDKGYLNGRNQQFMIVEFIGNMHQIGQFVDVEIERVNGFTLLGKQK